MDDCVWIDVVYNIVNSLSEIIISAFVQIWFGVRIVHKFSNSSIVSVSPCYTHSADHKSVWRLVALCFNPFENRRRSVTLVTCVTNCANIWTWYTDMWVSYEPHIALNNIYRKQSMPHMIDSSYCNCQMVLIRYQMSNWCKQNPLMRFAFRRLSRDFNKCK